MLLLSQPDFFVILFCNSSQILPWQLLSGTGFLAFTFGPGFAPGEVIMRVFSQPGTAKLRVFS